MIKPSAYDIDARIHEVIKDLEVYILKVGMDRQPDDGFVHAKGLLQTASRAIILAERVRKRVVGACQRCYHTEGSHVDDTDVMAPPKYNCQIECCSCPEYVKRT